VFQSVDKRTFDLLLAKLNENTQGVTFSGNYVFQFHPNQKQSYNFEVISKSDDYLDFQSVEVVPFVDIQNIEIPFVTKNDRDDMEREFYVAIKIDRAYDSVTNVLEIEFDDTNSQYQAVLETLDTIKNELTFVDGDYKYTFKTKSPEKVNKFKYNNQWYQIFALVFNLTSVKKGYFGNETKLYFGLESDTSFDTTTDYQLDVVEYTPTMGKETRPNSNTDDIEQKVSINRRTWQCTIVVNFTGNIADLLLQHEVDATTATNNVKYILQQTKTNLDTDTGDTFGFTRDVYVTSANATYQNNTIDQIIIKLERA
jgi:hypothetical protein